MNNEDEVVMVQYKEPPLWWEFSAYAGMLFMFVLMAVYTVNIWAAVVLTGWAMYWNYHLFRIIREYVRYVNANQINNLLTAIVDAELNKQKDGTFQDSDCLTKEQDDVETKDE